MLLPQKAESTTRSDTTSRLPQKLNDLSEWL